MRLWHKYLINLLPRQQLLGQWRECCCIAKSIAETGSPNHILVNKIMDYPLAHFRKYSRIVYLTARARGYDVKWESFAQHLDIPAEEIPLTSLFPKWHTQRYLKQCLFNLEEKYDCGGISRSEWLPIYDKFKINMGVLR